MKNNNSSLALVIDNRRKVLKGGFRSTTNQYIQTWKYLRAKLLVFVSSTFTDTHRERNVLLEKIMPLLREEGIKYDVEVTFVDMRWGVRDENTLDHLTWIACCNELERCRVESTSLFFLSLQSDKYGYMPIPKLILQSDYELRYNLADESTKSVADLWYYLDNNAIPPVYVLKQLDSISDGDYWNNVLPILRQMLSEVPFDRIHSDDLVVNRSVTEWETKYGLLNDASLPRCIWLHRHFKGGIIDKTKQDPRMLLVDAYDSSTKIKLENLKAWMVSRLSSNPSAIIKNYDITVDSYNEQNDDWHQYLNDWEKNTSEMLFTELNYILAFQKDWSETGNGIGIPGHILREMLHHYEWAYEKCESFAGRDAILKNAITYFNKNNKSDGNSLNDQLPEMLHISKHPHMVKRLPKVYSGNYGCDICGQSGSGVVYHCDECGFDAHPNCAVQDSSAAKEKSNTDFDGISFFFSGQSGCGKTALMSKLAELLYLEESVKESPRPIIIRFCGTSGGSVDGLSLVRSICHQILFISENMHISIPSDYENAVRLFHELLKQVPLILIIDSIDQLDDRFLARSRISFLKGVQPHSDTRIILSSLPDSEEHSSLSHFYGPQTCLRACEVREILVPMLDNNADDVKIILESILRMKKRTLTKEQFQLVVEKSMIEPSPLYLMLSSLIFTTFKSFDSLDKLNLVDGVENVLNQLFDNLERNYGKELTRAALGYITFSVSGIGDIEMEDLLSLNDIVLDKVFQYSQPGIRRLPVHVWLRLRSELVGLVFEVGNGCLSWYHRKIKVIVESRYTSEERVLLQAIMGKYFGGLVDTTLMSARKISVQPLTINNIPIWFPICKINIRRCTEAPFSLVRSELYEEAIEQICDMEMICACCKAGLGFNLLVVLIELREKILLQNNNKVSLYSLKKLNHYYRWLKFDLTAINTAPSELVSGACTSSQAKLSIPRRDIESIIDITHQHLTEQNQDLLFSSDSWIRSRSLGNPVESDLIIYNLIGHQGSLLTTDLSLDGKRLVSSSTDYSSFVWDVETGSIVAILELFPRTLILCARWDLIGTKIFTGCADGSLNVFNSKTGVKLNAMVGHAGKVVSLCWNRTYDLIASGGDDKKVVIWNPSSLTITNVLSGSSNSLLSLSWSIDSNYLCACDNEKSVYIWNTVTTNLKVESSGHLYGVRCVSWCPNKNLFATASDDTTIGIWELLPSEGDTSVRKVRSLQGHRDVIYYLCWCSDGDRLASGGRDQVIRIWNAITGELLKILDGNISPVLTLSWDNINNIVISGAADGKLTAWDVSIVNNEERKLIDKKKGIFTVSWSNDGEKIASGHDDGMIFVWSATSNLLLTHLSGHLYTVYCLSWSHNNENLASCSSDKTIKVWNLDKRCLLYTFNGFDSTIWSIAWSPDDSQLISGAADCDGNLRILNLSNQTIEVSERVNFITSVAWSKCGKSIYIGFYNGAIINYNASNLSVIYTIREPIENNGLHLVYSIAVSESGDKLLTSNNSGVVTVWDISNGIVSDNKQLRHKYGVRSAVWSPCGSRIITACYDNIVRVWKVQDGSIIASLQGHNDKVMSVSCSPCGCYIASGSLDKSIRVWDSVSLEWIKSKTVSMSNKLSSNKSFADSSKLSNEDILTDNKSDSNFDSVNLNNVMFSDNLSNLSLFKPARMSSQHTQFHPGNAVDGNLNTICHTHNSQGFTPHWWEVSIGLSKVVSINIFNRGTCQRLRDITLTFHHLDNIVHTSNMLNIGNIMGGPEVIDYNPIDPVICDRIRITRYPDPDNRRQLPNGSDERGLDRQLILSMSNVVVNGYAAIPIDI